MRTLSLKLNTSSRDKLKEFKRLGLAELECYSVDLPEPNASPLEVIASKATQVGEMIIVEDTSLDIDGVDIGVNIKWLIDSLGQHIGRKAVFRVLLGVQRNGCIEVYAGEVQGIIVLPKGQGFGFDPYFLPDGSERTLGEEKPDRFNARALAVTNFLNENPSDLLEPLHWDGEWQ